MILKHIFYVSLVFGNKTVNESSLELYWHEGVKSGTDEWTAELDYAVRKAELLIAMQGLRKQGMYIVVQGINGETAVNISRKIGNIDKKGIDMTDEQYIAELYDIVHNEDKKRMEEYEKQCEEEAEILEFMLNSLS